MFVIDMKKGFYTSFFINIGLALLLLIMTILYFTKGAPSNEENLGLQQLSIDEYDIDFKSDIYAYHITVDENVEELDFGYVTYEKSAEVKIEGNENFNEGNNQVIITVSEESKDDKIYYVIVEKIIGKIDEDIEKEQNIDANI